MTPKELNGNELAGGRKGSGRPSEEMFGAEGINNTVITYS